MDQFEDSQNIVLNLGILCQLKSEVFKSLHDQTQCVSWMDMAQKVFNFFFWQETTPFTMQNPPLYEDLCQRLIYAAITIHKLKYKFNPVHNSPEVQDVHSMLRPSMVAVTHTRIQGNLLISIGNKTITNPKR